MARLGNLVLRPWIRELILGSEALSSPRAGQLLKVRTPLPFSGPGGRGPRAVGLMLYHRGQVLQEAETPGPSRASDTSHVDTALLVSDGTHSIRCLVTREALNASDW